MQTARIRRPFVIAATAVLMTSSLAACIVAPPRPPEPAPRVEVVPVAPAPAYHWVRGHYRWARGEWVWVPGHWQPN
ncbi:YXWGXW repeat-containing protein [Robbsia andropogonis]|uniref:YXWGXW repeat-containing protein n=2 Tax=Robbsia andropogonis TaxID=28092 RepID=UPI0009DDFE88|nr:YXWGXW repeat-containing protein [Robbsia andropogonis]MCP1117319.1 YXWGXW repeat-containing protein [Robbsia andropogonis]MCP1129286.1 YXWGXW repeat-containing protein [Robbsia andropogonis]